jgi:hypothetical protein
MPVCGRRCVRNRAKSMDETTLNSDAQVQCNINLRANVRAKDAFAFTSPFQAPSTKDHH